MAASGLATGAQIALIATKARSRRAAALSQALSLTGFKVGPETTLSDLPPEASGKGVRVWAPPFRNENAPKPDQLPLPRRLSDRSPKRPAARLIPPLAADALPPQTLQS